MTGRVPSAARRGTVRAVSIALLLATGPSGCRPVWVSSTPREAETPEPSAVRDPGAGTPERRASEGLVAQALELLERGEMEGANRRLEEAVRVDPTNGMALYHLARVRVRQGRREEALGLVERARQLLRAYPERAARADSLYAALGGG